MTTWLVCGFFYTSCPLEWINSGEFKLGFCSPHCSVQKHDPIENLANFVTKSSSFDAKSFFRSGLQISSTFIANFARNYFFASSCIILGPLPVDHAGRTLGLMQSRGVREWLSVFLIPPIPTWSIPFPFPKFMDCESYSHCHTIPESSFPFPPIPIPTKTAKSRIETFQTFQKRQCV